MSREGLRAALCCVDTQQLDASSAGHDFDSALLDALPEGVDPCGENGEFHTCVSDGPMFTAPLALSRGHTVLREPAPAQEGDRFAHTDYTLPPMLLLLPPLRRQGGLGRGFCPAQLEPRAPPP